MPETVPAQSTQDFVRDLKDPLIAVYAFVGAEIDRGWRVAKVSAGLKARLRVHRFDTHAPLKPWIGNKKPSGVLFGWGETVRSTLTKTEAADLLLVLEAIDESMKPPSP